MMMTSSYEPVRVRAHALSIHMQHHMPRTGTSFRDKHAKWKLYILSSWQ